ncbi:hypothetical protein [Roseomonas sp. KE0001]|uniref:hypothetical protein n=1 Tax=Roseomonas sp. KE0001 TaxID=2479201 RepID=UPI0018DF171D|nr:hypothetical protein [Roseomonas sp. KE0001]MBI0434686.1 hypothetical protein [Roseomonas sp. KE0001]
MSLPVLAAAPDPTTPLYYAHGYALHLLCACGQEAWPTVEEIALSRRFARDTRLADLPRRLPCAGCGATPELRAVLPAPRAGRGGR